MTDTPAVTPIVLPTSQEPPRRGPLPLVASVVPVLAAVVMWLVTGSVLMLCFAALGPLMAIASLADGARGRRRDRRAAARQLDEACDRAEAEIERRHRSERMLLERSRPDTAGLAAERASWARGPHELVVGRGRVAAQTRVSGGEGERAERLRERAGWITDAPVVVPARGGVCVQGEVVAARAVARALLLQLCLRAAPEDLAVVAVPETEEGALGELPHVRSGAALRTALAWGAAPSGGADILVVAVGPGEAAPAGCARVLELDARQPLTARMHDAQGEEREVAVEALSAAQAGALARSLHGRARGGVPAPLTLAELPDPTGDGNDLSATIGRAASAEATVDLVTDGPHAVVVGMTGSGKSELLTTWVVSLARRLGPERVTFLLADFKGGTAFEALAALPHVTGVVTDLDGAGARRAVESLRAELRRREAALARAGARDVADPRVAMPRLVIVVDEFAALLQDHADLHAVFTDIAARGRALGMHLILGTQRGGGVLREALLANCPLRVALRVADAADSRLVVGTDAAAALAGDPGSCGVALIRRAGDAAPRLCRIARTQPSDLSRIAPAGAVPAAPWLPPLPALLSLSDLRQRHDAGAGILLGLADEPEQQRQVPVVLRPGADRGLAILGGAGTGRTAAIRLVAAQAESAGVGALVLPADPEAAWDAVAAAARRPPGIVAVDDLDALLARFPADYAGELLARVEALARDAGALGTTLVCSAARAVGPAARVLELMPRRVLLRLPSRADHVAAGGEGSSYDASRPAGRAVIDGREVQLAWPGPAVVVPEPTGPEKPWRPEAAATALVLRGAVARAGLMAEAWGRRVRVVALDGLDPGTRLSELAAGAERIAIAGDGESWLRHGALLREVRSRGELVIAAECAAELRTMAGERELPPYALPRASRAWVVRDRHAPRRVLLP
ncbi:FtsK/SpoIIIE domain-containing protein [Microbacterium sp. Marseille-Q6965]|uniref:FtsK/SpoIIIE domain-containing protein n=1 Tax=Microbacterium sp. Marseille-Q6965 TaxID=2965072 RepID=UPI0021B846BA|nr:FtsK/SpoIIIE domain-containing protein [Microbacterium sp. Marseille-Q6965]